MELYSVIAGGALAIVSATTAQWLTHIFSARRERNKLIHEKAEELCEQVHELIGWLSDRCYKTLALKNDEDLLPPISKLVALQSLYFREAEAEVANASEKAVEVFHVLKEAYPAMMQASLEVISSRATGGDVTGAMGKEAAVREEMTAAINVARLAFVAAATAVTKKIVALVHEKTK